MCGVVLCCGVCLLCVGVCCVLLRCGLVCSLVLSRVVLLLGVLPRVVCGALCRDRLRCVAHCCVVLVCGFVYVLGVDVLCGVAVWCCCVVCWRVISWSCRLCRFVLCVVLLRCVASGCVVLCFRLLRCDILCCVVVVLHCVVSCGEVWLC